jgi:hypothetical protein
MFAAATLLRLKIEQRNRGSNGKSSEGLELRLGGRRMLRRRGKGDGQRAGKMKKKNQNALSCQPGQPEREMSTSSQITGNVEEILRVLTTAII